MLFYVLLAVISFILPGALIGRLLGLRPIIWIIALPFSYMFLVANVFLARYFQLGIGIFQVLLVVELIALTLAVAYARWREAARSPATASTTSTTGKFLYTDPASLLVVSVTMGLALMYFAWIGPYTEVPSDFWSHVGKIQEHFLYLEANDVLQPFLFWRNYGGKPAEYWYVIQSLLVKSAGISVEESFAPQSLVNSMMIVVAVFLFTVRILAGGEIGNRGRIVVAAISVFFFVTHFGTNVFSFARYYTFGPVFFNYIVYLSFALLLVEFLGRSTLGKAFYVPVLLAMVALMGIVHLQEAMFAMILGYAVLFVYWLRITLQGHGVLEGSEGSRVLGKQAIDRLFLIASVFVVGAWIAARIYLRRHDPLDNGRMIPLEEMLPFVRHMFVLDPNHQFYQTLTLWGYFVLVLAVVYWRRLKLNPYLVVGVLSPFYTVLNPLFTDFFLRLSWPDLIWRLLYMAPLYIVGAAILYHSVRSVMAGRHFLERAFGAIVAVALIVFVAPVDTPYVKESYSRIQTLRPIDPGNDYEQWKDVYAYLNSLDRRYTVLTDPITGYTLTALTKHRYLGAKFYTCEWCGYQDFNQRRYSIRKYEMYDRWLLIINLRDGERSITGEMSRHWRSDQLKVSEYYDDDFIEFVNDNPEHFQKIGELPDVTIYRLSTKP